MAFVLAASLLTRCVLLLAAFLLLPPHTWPSLTWAAYVVNATSSPVAHALAMGVYNLLVKVGKHCNAQPAQAHNPQASLHHRLPCNPGVSRLAVSPAGLW